MIIDVKLALFYIFSAMVVTTSLSVILAKHPVKAVLSLVLAFVASAGLWLLLNAEFLALILIVVYVGAVMVLFLFVVMMLDVDLSALRAGFINYFPLAVVLAGGFFGVLSYVFSDVYFRSEAFTMPIARPENYSNIKELGLELYTKYVYSFEIAAALLMVAIIAAIALAFRGAKDRQNQNISEQVRVTKQDRLKIIKM
jgi:NADH-quinone oxidoreductase subunit J